MRETIRWERVFAAAAIGWASALLPATLAASHPRASTASDLFALTVYAVGGIVCHQLPARSFHLWSAAMPVCARCAGLYAGAGLAAVILLIRGGSRAIGSDAMRRALAMAALPTLATLLVESVTGATPANWIRAGAGVPLGAAVAWAIGSVTHVK